MTPSIASFLRGAPARANTAARHWDLARRVAANAGRPVRPHLREAWAVADRYPREPWLPLIEAGLLPASWADDPARGFVWSRDRFRGIYRGWSAAGSLRIETMVGDELLIPPRWAEGLDEPGMLVSREDRGPVTYVPALAARPTDPLLAVALAADAENVIRAEALALEVAERLVPWGAEPVVRVGWELLPPGAALGLNVGMLRVRRFLDAVGASVTRLALDAGELRDLTDRACDAVPSHTASGEAHPAEGARAFVIDNTAWVRAARAGERAPGDAPPALRRFADLANPFDPLLEVMAAGYSTMGQEGREMRLFAPVPPREVRRDR